MTGIFSSSLVFWFSDFFSLIFKWLQKYFLKIVNPHFLFFAFYSKKSPSFSLAVKFSFCDTESQSLDFGPWFTNLWQLETKKLIHELKKKCNQYFWPCNTQSINWLVVIKFYLQQFWVLIFLADWFRNMLSITNSNFSWRRICCFSLFSVFVRWILLSFKPRFIILSWTLGTVVSVFFSQSNWLTFRFSHTHTMQVVKFRFQNMHLTRGGGYTSKTAK